MDGIYTFISAIVNSLAWPFTVIILLLLLKNPINFLINNIENVKYKDIEINLRKKIDQINEQVKKADLHLSGSADYSFEVRKSLSDLVSEIAHTSPEAAIPFAWSQVESELRKIVEIHNIQLHPGKPKSSVNQLVSLLHAGIIDKEILKSINGMRMLRNAISHNYRMEERITVKDAIEYGKTAEKIIQILEKSKIERGV